MTKRRSKNQRIRKILVLSADKAAKKMNLSTISVRLNFQQFLATYLHKRQNPILWSQPVVIEFTSNVSLKIFRKATFMLATTNASCAKRVQIFSFP